MFKRNKKIKTENVPGIKQKSILPGAIIAGLIISIVIYAVMIHTQQKALTDYAKGTVYTVKDTVPEGTIINEQNVNTYFLAIDIDAKIIPATSVKTLEELIGLIPSYNIEKGTIITSGMFQSINEITDTMTDPCIVGFKADDLYQVINGVLRQGDKINIYCISEDGNNKLFKANVFVQTVFDQTGKNIANSDMETPAQRVNIYLDNSDVSKFYEELAKGTIRVAKIDE